ncbi:MAG: DNA polymerase III subunit beta [Tannerella sp.]|jgi:DNA polymerase-3 subunit beta|nr:DNA polymerase III subunit beta [Tannerella sp.]
MKFNVSSSSLLNTLQSISKVISSKNTLPILDSFLFNIEGDKLTITASDQEIRLVSSINVINAVGSGLIAIEAKRLLEPLKELPDQPLDFEVNDDNLAVTVKYSNGKFNIPGQGGDAYPQQKPISPDSKKISIESNVLLSGLSRALFAAAEDEFRPVMAGIFLDIQPESLTFVASDGHKLVRLRNKSVTSGITASLILPKKPISLLKSLLVKNSDTVAVEFDSNNVYFKTATFEMVCRLIEGNYPNYEAVIPTDNPNIVTIDRLSFLTALKRVSIFTSESSGLVKIEIADNLLTISAQDLDFSTSADETIACLYSSEPISIGFKSSFLIDILSNMTAGSLDFQLADSSRAGVIVPTLNEENENDLMLLMPMMLSD